MYIHNEKFNTFFFKFFLSRVYQNDCKIRYMRNSKEAVIAWCRENKPKRRVIASKALCVVNETQGQFYLDPTSFTINLKHDCR